MSKGTALIKLCNRSKITAVFLLVFCSAFSVPLLRGQGFNGPSTDSSDTEANCSYNVIGSPYIPVDSWVYPAAVRLYSIGFLDRVFLNLRPWTRASIRHMLEDTGDKIRDAEEGPLKDEAQDLYFALSKELQPAANSGCAEHSGTVNIESTYTMLRSISGTSLNDSFHLGSTIINDYGRHYENGINNYTGASGYASVGRFTFYARGEFQGVPSADGYSPSLYQALANADLTTNPITGIAYSNQATIPIGPIARITQARFLEAYISAQVLNHVISFGKHDEWIGPAQGASMAYSNNAENIYTFHINRVEPLYIPLLSRITGPFRYEFFVGPLRGHTKMPNPLYANNPAEQPNVISPGNPWVHLEKVSFRPTENIEFGFERTALFGGKGHSPVNLHTFIKSFLSTVNVGLAEKFGRNDPGARFAAFDFSYRLPFLRNWLTLYSDSEVHDDVSPTDAPRHASVRPGLYLSHVPGVPKLDIRFEGVSTDPPTNRSNSGQFMYWEYLEKQGCTNQGQMFGDWIGREGKGGQAWITYHLTGNEWLQVGARHQKVDKDFIAGGTTLNDFNFQVLKRIGRDLELNGNFTFEHWKAPIYLSERQTVTATSIQLTWYPHEHVNLSRLFVQHGN